ncbi:MAG: hypothetical protein WCG85_11860 [Polyangia bacterium]
MPPEHRTVIELRRLLRDNEADAIVLDALRAEISVMNSRPGPLGPEAAAYLAVKLHAWYTAFESILERIARVVEGGLPGGPSYHQDLLRGMTLPLAVVRPAVIDSTRLGDLAELLAFRHFFRHAYAVALDEAELRNHAVRLERTHPGVREDLRCFEQVVLGWIQKLEGAATS